MESILLTIISVFLLILTISVYSFILPAIEQTKALMLEIIEGVVNLRIDKIESRIKKLESEK